MTDSELHEYEERLVDECEHRFSFVADIAETSQAGPKVSGHRFYRGPPDRDLWIRPRCQERFIARGSYHKLADELKSDGTPNS